VTVDGLVVLDKPAGWTSHDVVARVRRITGTRKVGHAGTLDPLATGVLVVGVGRATRLLTFLVGLDKAYRATIRLGARTLTDDRDGEVLERADTRGVSRQAIADGVARLSGEIEQVPSAVSAVKIAGKPAHSRVRAGETVDLPPRAVTVSRFEVLDLRRLTAEDGGSGEVIDLDVEVDCSSGTYVRALARDLGADLGVGGHLTALRRTKVGPYGLDGARTLDQFAADGRVVPLEEAARAAFPARELTETEAWRLGHGQRIASRGECEGPMAAFGPDGSLVAIVSQSGPTCRSLVVLTPA
jgi:tRNA pseudouridine55 synthase